MTQEEFKKILNEEEIKFTQEGEQIVISNNNDGVFLSFLTTIPSDVRFENQRDVYLRCLTTIPKGVKFENNEDVWLNSLATLPKGMRFENNGYVFLNSKATRFNPIFRNKGNVYLISYYNKMKGIPNIQVQHGTKLIFEQ